jgi:hypothetical protein
MGHDFAIWRAWMSLNSRRKPATLHFPYTKTRLIEVISTPTPPYSILEPVIFQIIFAPPPGDRDKAFALSRMVWELLSEGAQLIDMKSAASRMQG